MTNPVEKKTADQHPNQPPAHPGRPEPWLPPPGKVILTEPRPGRVDRQIIHGPVHIVKPGIGKQILKG